MHFTLFEATASGRRRGCSENIRRYSPTRTSQTRARKHARPDTHTPTRAPWQIITPTASGEQNAHVGPITALDKGHGTPKTLLLCLSPKPCVCFAWLSEPDLRIFTAIWSPCIPAGLKMLNPVMEQLWKCNMQKVLFLRCNHLVICPAEKIMYLYFHLL